MDESPEIIARRESYSHSHAVEVEGLLGLGLDGSVWRTNSKTALKTHKYRSTYDRERDAYLRLKSRSLHRLAGFSIPRLLDYDDSCLVLELSIVERPFVLDFAMASIDKRPGQFDDSSWWAEKARLYGRDWPDVQRLLEALMQYGIFFLDIHKQNISLRPDDPIDSRASPEPSRT